MSDKLENVPYNDITIGQSCSYQRQLTDRDVRLFAATSGDVNPVHLDEAYAATTMFGGRIAHGIWTAGLVSAALATYLPGPGCIYLEQSLRFERPVKINDTLEAQLRVTDKEDTKHIVVLDCKVVNQHGKVVLSGTAKVKAAVDKISLPKPVVEI